MTPFEVLAIAHTVPLSLVSFKTRDFGGILHRETCLEAVRNYLAAALGEAPPPGTSEQALAIIEERLRVSPLLPEDLRV